MKTQIFQYIYFLIKKDPRFIFHTTGKRKSYIVIVYYLSRSTCQVEEQKEHKQHLAEGNR